MIEDNEMMMLQDKKIDELSIDLEQKDKAIQELYEIISEKEETIKFLQDKLTKIKLNKEDKNNNEKEYYYFYILSNGCDNCFKIGITRNLKTRISTIQTGNHHDIKIINYFVSEKNSVIEFERLLKNIMSDYNVSGEWFELSNEDKLDFFNFINQVKLGDKTIDELSSYVPEKGNIKLSQCNIFDLINILKSNGFYKKNNKLIYYIKETNQIIDDYEYFFDTTKVITNDLTQQKFKQLFKRLNQEHFLNQFNTFYFNCYFWKEESLNEYFNQFDNKINSLIGISFNVLYKDYSDFCKKYDFIPISQNNFLKTLMDNNYKFIKQEFINVFGEKETIDILFNFKEFAISNEIARFYINDLGKNFNNIDIFFNDNAQKVNVKYLLSKKDEIQEYFFS